MNSLQDMRDKLINYAETAMADLRHVNTRALGDVIDMIKDLSEAIYYYSMVK